jgi:hypothetical protein
MPVLPKPCLRSASPSYRSARAAQPGCPARDHDSAANSSAPHIMTRFSARSSDSTTSRACRHLQSSARRAPYTPMQEKRNASATKSASPPRKRARKRKRRKPAEQRVKPAAPLATKDAFAVLFGDATTIAARSSPFARVAKPSGSAAFASSPSRAVESSAPAASPGNANDVAKNPRAAIGKRAQSLTVGARPTAVGKHLKAVPERLASTTQPSCTTSSRGRSKTAQSSTKRKRNRAKSSPSARTAKSSPARRYARRGDHGSADIVRASAAHPHRRRDAPLRPRRIQSGAYLRRRRRQTQRRQNRQRRRRSAKAPRRRPQRMQPPPRPAAIRARRPSRPRADHHGSQRPAPISHATAAATAAATTTQRRASNRTCNAVGRHAVRRNRTASAEAVAFVFRTAGVSPAPLTLAPTRHHNSKTPAGGRRYINQATPHRDEWADSAKFFRRARRAVPLLTSTQRRQRFLASRTQAPAFQ